MYPCIHEYKHTCMDEHVQIYIYIYMHMCVSWCMHQHIHIHSCISVSMWALWCSVLVCIYVHIHKHTYVHACICTCIGILATTWDQCCSGIKWTSSHTQITAQWSCGVNIYIYAALPQSYVGHVYRWLGRASGTRQLWLVPHMLHNSTQTRCMAGSGLRFSIMMKRICRFEIVIKINRFQCRFSAKSKVWAKNIL